MLIIDAHLDLAWNALQWNRDLTQSVYTLRVREQTIPGRGRAVNTVALPELRRGRVALCFATLMARSTGRPLAHVDFDSTEQAYATACGHRAYYEALELRGHARLIGNVTELDDHMAEWHAWERTDSPVTPPLGIVISMESADPILFPDQVAYWYAQGVRLIGPAHQGPGRYVGGTGVEDGFNAAGLELLRQIEAAGIILDLTHLPDAAFWQALERFSGPVIASHNACRALAPHQRQFDDAQIKAIAERGGVIGMGFDLWMLIPGFIKGSSTTTGTSISLAVDHIDHICQLTGSAQHAAIGSDLDGGFGRDQAPGDLDTIADLQMLTGIMERRGYSAADIAAIMHGNWLSLLRRVWANGASPV